MKTTHPWIRRRKRGRSAYAVKKSQIHKFLFTYYRGIVNPYGRKEKKHDKKNNFCKNYKPVIFT
jgi:hypothetical protein